jgi:hypothetical protein
MTEYKTSRAYIVPSDVNQRFVYALDSSNPEKILIESLKNFIRKIGYSEMYPNFSNIRVSGTHPFSLLLAQEILGEKTKSNPFPSITIADSDASEDSEVLGDDYNGLSFTPAQLAKLDGYRQANEIFISDSGWTKIQTAMNTNGFVVGVQKTFRTKHTMHFNIWSANREVTSFLYDMVTHFIIQNKASLHTDNGLDIGPLTGRRTGDINLDFGMLLYGANVSVPAIYGRSSVLFDTSLGSIAEIDVKTYPQYFTF